MPLVVSGEQQRVRLGADESGQVIGDERAQMGRDGHVTHASVRLRCGDLEAFTGSYHGSLDVDHCIIGIQADVGIASARSTPRTADAHQAASRIIA